MVKRPQAPGTSSVTRPPPPISFRRNNGEDFVPPPSPLHPSTTSSPWSALRRLPPVNPNANPESGITRIEPPSGSSTYIDERGGALVRGEEAGGTTRGGRGVFRAVSFPRARDPDRAGLYQRAMSGAFPRKSIASKIGAVGVYCSVGYMVWFTLMVYDWGDEKFLGKQRRERIEQIALRRPLTPTEQAQLDRPFNPGQNAHPANDLPLRELFARYPIHNMMRRAEAEDDHQRYLERQRIKEIAKIEELRYFEGKLNWRKYCDEELRKLREETDFDRLELDQWRFRTHVA